MPSPSVSENRKCETVFEMSVPEALAVLHEHRGLGDPNRFQRNALAAAKETIKRASIAAINRMVGSVCTTCWGDGWHRITETMLAGPCESCNGTGHQKDKPPHDN